MTPYKDGCCYPHPHSIRTHRRCWSIFHAAASVQILTCAGKPQPQVEEQWQRCSRTQAVLAGCPKNHSSVAATGPRTTTTSAPSHSHFSLINTWAAGRVPCTAFLHPCASTQDPPQPWPKAAETKPLTLQHSHHRYGSPICHGKCRRQKSLRHIPNCLR